MGDWTLRLSAQKQMEIEQGTIKPARGLGINGKPVEVIRARWMPLAYHRYATCHF